MQGEPLHCGVKYTGVRKFWDFRLKSPFISETLRDIVMILFIGSQVADRSVSVPMTLSDFERRDTCQHEGSNVQADLLNNAGTFWTIGLTTKFGRITHRGRGRGVFLYGSSTSPPQRGVPQHSPHFGFPFYLCVHRTLCWITTKFDVVTHLWRGLVFRRQPRPTIMAAGPSAPAILVFPSNYAYTTPVVSGFVKQGAHPTNPGWRKPHIHFTPNL